MSVYTSRSHKRQPLDLWSRVLRLVICVVVLGQENSAFVATFGKLGFGWDCKYGGFQFDHLVRRDCHRACGRGYWALYIENFLSFIAAFIGILSQELSRFKFISEFALSNDSALFSPCLGSNVFWFCAMEKQEGGEWGICFDLTYFQHHFISISSHRPDIRKLQGQNR